MEEGEITNIDGGGGFDYVEYNGNGRTNVNADLSTNTVTFTSDTMEIIIPTPSQTLKVL